jgi:serpin B
MNPVKTNGTATPFPVWMFCGLVLVALVVLFSLPSFVRAGEQQDLTNGNTRFAFDLYRQLARKGADGNLFFSPISISTALGMTYSGARGNTEKQMSQALHFDLSQQRLHPAFSQLLSGLKGDKDYELEIANRLWGQKDYKFLPDFLKTAETNYQGGFQELDFRGNLEPSRKTINTWVEEKTKQKIKELLVSGDINGLTRLVLTNAIYFKGSWVSKFDPKLTHEAPFYLRDGKTSTADLMRRKGRFNYLEDKMFEAIELPYAGEKLSMVVVLPRKGVEFEKVEQLLSPENLRLWVSSMTKEEAVVFLPKFKTTMRFVLNSELAALGMPDAFNEMAADFSGMTGAPKLYISLVVHKAFVDVSEEGTEAAAATGVVMATKGMSYETTFRADHPFIFAILDKKSGSVLFLGRLMNPREG